MPFLERVNQTAAGFSDAVAVVGVVDNADSAGVHLLLAAVLQLLAVHLLLRLRLLLAAPASL
jgi:hypothetical protein